MRRSAIKGAARGREQGFPILWGHELMREGLFQCQAAAFQRRHHGLRASGSLLGCVSVNVSISGGVDDDLEALAAFRRRRVMVRTAIDGADIDGGL